MAGAARSTPDMDRLAEEAAGWVARLQSSDATAHDQRAFEDWVSRSPAHRPAFEEMKGLWADLRDVPLEGKAAKAGLTRRGVIGNIVALGLIAGLGTTAYRMGLLERLRADHYTAVGEVRRVTLADGSIVDLNTDSAITVHYTAARRRVELLRGEAFFSVAKNPDRPFVVADSALSATALGTRFSVRLTGADGPGGVGVEEGRVEVANAQERVILGPGEMARLAGGGRLAVSRADVSSDTAWRDGKLVFSGQKLRDVLATLRRYRHGQILILDDAAANQTVSGIFDLADTDEALSVLEQSLPVRITHLTGMVVLVSSR
ncbi:iron dicitrate transporter FecR [Azorhizobium oxalatiphilum]|uniref:Iron dicitrate transporter FecR n=1 Tax=Azorhizobium oxalatiphilum TaxID=980631 RepID=A0A917F7N9_9HYPH|nr:FecR family protein [Azorhizobium oxalatiphilum]GGF58265.1 iron dicitrate transporter FecR [Azorhizobium oxalatiphilum]